MSSLFVRLGQVLKELDDVHADLRDNELQQLAEEAKSGVAKLKNALRRTQVKQVAQLVQARQVSRATRAMNHHFGKLPGQNIVQDILELVYDSGLDGLLSAFKWSDQLDVQLRPRIYESLYEQIKLKNLTDQPQVLMLWRRVAKLSGGFLTDLKAQLDKHFQDIVKSMAKGVEKSDYSESIKIGDLDQSTVDFSEGGLLLNEIVVAVVRKFDACNLEQILLLIKYSADLPYLQGCCILVDAVLQTLEANDLLDSEQAMHLWAHAKYIKEEDPSDWKKMSPVIQKLGSDALEKLEKHRTSFFRIYQRFVENQKIDNLHKQNFHLQSFTCAFVSWYYRPDDLTRVHNLLLVAKECAHTVLTPRILSQLHQEMLKFQQTNTFETFRLFHVVKSFMAVDVFESEEPVEVKALFERLMAKAPSCLRLLLWPEAQGHQQLRLVNKFYDSALCMRQKKVLCCSPDEHQEKQLCSATVHPDTALTKFSFYPGRTRWNLHAKADLAKVALTGTSWSLKPDDEQHVKIFNEKGLFLMAGEPWQVDESKRVVCLKRENSTDMQLWKIEPPPKKKILLE